MGDYTVHNVQFYDYKPSSINCMAYDEVTEQLAVGYAGGGVCIYHVRQDFYQTQFVAPSVLKSVEGLCWLTGGRLFACGISGYVSELDPRLGTLLHQIPTYAMGAWCMCADNSRSQLAVGTENGAVCLYKIDDISGKLEFSETLQRAPSRILAVSWNQFDSNLIATSGVGFLSVVDLRHGLVVQEFPCKPLTAAVWDIVFLNSDIIASGDSTGQVVFWSVKAGGAVQRFSSHLSQVLCLEVFESSLFASGVDPVIRRYDLLSSGNWCEGPIYRRHSHDVRTLAMTAKGLASAGLEGKVIVFPFHGLVAGVQEGVRCVWPLSFVQPRHPALVSVSDYRRTASDELSPPLCVLNYPDRMEIHSLGLFNRRRRRDRNASGPLSLTRPSARLHAVVPRRGESLVCSAISPCASWLAYSSPSCARVLRLKTTSGAGAEQVHLSRCGALLPPCRLLFFLPSARLVCVRQDGRVALMACDDAAVAVSALWEFQPGNDEYSSPDAHLLAVGGDFIALGCLDGHVYVYSAKERRKVAQLPLRRPKRARNGRALMPTALSLHPTKPLLLVVYTDRVIVEVNLTDNSPGPATGWLNQFKQLAPEGWRMATHFDWLQYVDGQRILVANPRLLVQLDTNVKVPPELRKAVMVEDEVEVERTPTKRRKSETEDWKTDTGVEDDGQEETTPRKKRRRLDAAEEKAMVAARKDSVVCDDVQVPSKSTNSCMHVTSHYQFIFHAQLIRKHELLLVNMKPDNYVLSLPAALYKKRYGV